MSEKEKIYIERQRNYTKQRGSFGPLGNISANGCGAVALYNVLMYFGIRSEFMSIVNRFNRRWLFSTGAAGVLGTTIYYLFYELKRYHFRVYPVIFTKHVTKNFHLDENSAMILLYYWRKNRKLGAHYQAGFGSTDGTITLHNPKAAYMGIQDLLREKKTRENMWFCFALMIRKTKR